MISLSIIEEEFKILNTEHLKLLSRKAKNEEYENNARRMLILTTCMAYICTDSNRENSAEDAASAKRMYDLIQVSKKIMSKK